MDLFLNPDPNNSLKNGHNWVDLNILLMLGTGRVCPTPCWKERPEPRHKLSHVILLWHTDQIYKEHSLATKCDNEFIFLFTTGKIFM